MVASGTVQIGDHVPIGFDGRFRIERACDGSAIDKVKAVAAESRSSEGGIAEDYYAVLGVVGASFRKHSFFFLHFTLFTARAQYHFCLPCLKQTARRERT